MNAGDRGVQKRELATPEIPEASIASSCVPINQRPNQSASQSISVPINQPGQNAHANERPPKPERPILDYRPSL
jgi:hypothetical protein